MGSTGVDGDGFKMFNQRAETIRRRAIFNACSGDCFTGPLERLADNTGSRVSVNSSRCGSAENPLASCPSNTPSTSHISPLLMPFRYSHGKNASSVRVFRTYGGISQERNVTNSRHDNCCPFVIVT